MHSGAKIYLGANAAHVLYDSKHILKTLKRLTHLLGCDEDMILVKFLGLVPGQCI